MEGNAITVKIGAETDQVEQGLRNIQASLGRLEQSSQQAGTGFDASFKKIAGATAVGELAVQGFQKVVDIAFTAAKAVVDSFGEALDLGGRLNELSQRTGETAGNLLVLETAFKNSGLAADQVGQVINKLQNFMQDASNGGERQTATMNRLGISLEELAGKTPTQQMQVFAKRISEIENPTERAATASDVFGEKLGGKLLPLLRDFAPTLEDSRDKVGSLAEIMDENAAIFDAAGETVDAVKGKLTAFAAGILSEVIPEIQSLGKSMAEVDAAGLGQEVGGALAPVLRDLNRLVGEAKMLMDQLAWAEQQARDNTGALGAAYDATQGALQTFNNALFDALSFVLPFDESIEALRDSFVGVKSSQEQATTGVNEIALVTAEATPKFNEAAAAADQMGLALENVGGDGASFASINQGATQFKSLLGEANVSLSDISGSISSQIPLQTEQIGLVGEYNATLGEANVKAGEQLQKLEQQIAAEESRNQKILERQEKSLSDYQLQIQINEALASGNIEEAKSLEYKRELEKLTAKIMQDTGMTSEQASGLATNILSSKAAADEFKGSMVQAGEETKTVRDVVNEIGGTEMDAPAKGLKERTMEARDSLSKMKDFIGEDLSKMSLDSIIEKLGLDKSGLSNSQDDLRDIETFIKNLGDADPADITPEVDKEGSKDNIAQIQEYLEKLKGTDATPAIDQSAVKQEADDAAATIKKELSKIEGDIKVNPKLNKEALKEEIDLALNSSEGSKILGEIKSIAAAIRTAVEKIEPKLPMQALAY